MIDSHTHLDLCEPPDAELVEAASAVGVTRMLTVGIDGASCRAALAAAEAFPQVFAAIGRHPNAAKGFDDADLAELQALAAHERCVAIGETRPRLLPRRRAARGPAARVRRADRAGARDSQAARDPLARGRRGDARAARRRSRRRQRRDALLLDARAAGTSACSAATRSRSPATSRTRARADLAEAAAAAPEERLLLETDAPYLTPQAVRKQRNQPAFVAHTLAFVAELRGATPAELGAAVERNAARVFGW